MTILTDQKKIQNIIQKYKLDQMLPKNLILQGELVVFNKDEIILTANEPINYFYFFLFGKLKLFRIYENGKTFLVQFYSEFDSLGDVELVNPQPASCSVTAVATSYLMRIPLEMMQREALEHIPFLKYLSRSLADKLLVADMHHSTNLMYPVVNRLSSYIRAHAMNSKRLTLLDSLTDISEYLGTTYRQLHRAFDDLEEKGIIKRKGRTLEIIDTEALSAIAGSIYEIDHYIKQNAKPVAK
ncbi:MAG: hypothetical protein BGO41_08815 [Clostridiales bacterium 38-18]|nr:MAG: hypothetical protein BGO41_08815 [Clostridiales bacterium 38-18]